MEDRGASKEELQTLLGRGRAKKGIFEGDLVEGELEIGQIASSIRQIVPAAQVVSEMIEDFNRTVERLKDLSF
jgi:enoyl-[acyl-carrier protein] reductase II